MQFADVQSRHSLHLLLTLHSLIGCWAVDPVRQLAFELTQEANPIQLCLLQKIESPTQTTKHCINSYLTLYYYYIYSNRFGILANESNTRCCRCDSLYHYATHVYFFCFNNK